MLRHTFAAIAVLLLCSGCLLAQAPTVAAGAAVNGASFFPANAPGSLGALPRGGIGSLFGANLTTSASAVVASSLPLPTDLGGTRVTIGEVPAPLFYVVAGQINFQVPWTVSTPTAQLVVTTSRGSSPPITVTLVDANPGLFSQPTNGRGPGAVLRFVTQTNTPLITATSTASPNGIVIIYGTGFGRVSPTPANGAAGTGAEVTTTQPVVMIGGRQAQVQFSGLAPGFVGLYQINAVVPAGTPEGCYIPLTVTVGAITSNTVTISVMNTSGTSCNAAASGSPGATLNTTLAVAGLTKTNLQFALPLPITPPTPADQFTASFRRFEGRIANTDAGFPPINGGCISALYRSESTDPPSGFFGKDRALNAGNLTLTGPFSGSPRTIAPLTPGEYAQDTPLAPGAYTLAGSGGSDVGSFTSSVTVAGPLFNVTSFGLVSGAMSQSRTTQVAWTCPDANAQVTLMLFSIDSQKSLYGSLVCTVQCSATQFTFSVEQMRQLPVSNEGGAGIFTFFLPSASGTGRIQASGLTEPGFFGYTITAGVVGASLNP